MELGGATKVSVRVRVVQCRDTLHDPCSGYIQEIDLEGILYKSFGNFFIKFISACLKKQDFLMQNTTTNHIYIIVSARPKVYSPPSSQR